MDIYKFLQNMNSRPEPYQYYTADKLWTDPYISRKMLEYHLDKNVNLASRKYEFIERSVDWLITRFILGSNSQVCDFGCGPGLYTTLLAEKGMKVTGIDFSRNSIEYAQKTARETASLRARR